MSPYLIGILVALLGVIAHAWTNIIDGYFSDKIFKRLTNLIFFSLLANILFLPIVLFTDFPKSVPISLWGILITISLIEVFYNYPYYWSLRRMDTSIIVSLFSLGKVFAPILAFLLVGEHLSTAQYVGFFIIILSSIFLTLDLKKLRFNTAFFLMLTVSILLTIEAVLYKYLFDSGVSWGSAVVWVTLLGAGISGILVLLPSNLKDFKEASIKAKSLGWLFFGNQFLTWGGEALNTLAIALIPVSIVKGITSTQSIFVFIFAIIFAKRLPFLFKEHVGKSGDTMKKVVFFTLIVFGTILITVGI